MALSSLDAVDRLLLRCDEFERNLDHRDTGKHANELARHYLTLTRAALAQLDDELRPVLRRHGVPASPYRNAHQG